MQTMEKDRLAYAVRKLPDKWRRHPQVMAIEGRAWCMLGEIAKGSAMIEQAHRLAPSDPVLACDAAAVSFSRGLFPQGIALLEGHLAAHGDTAPVLDHLRQAFDELRDWKKATDYAERLIRLDPASEGSLLLLGHRKQSLRRYDEAVDLLGKVRGKSRFAGGASMLMTMLYQGADPMRIRDETISFAADVWGGETRLPMRTQAKRADARLRVGLIGPCFVSHVVLRFLRGVLESHDRSKLWLGVYSATRNEDAETEVVRRHVDLFRNIWPLSDDVAAAQIREDGVDVLVDLGGLAGGTRIGVLARRAAPVQATYLAYPATTGIPEVDYRITDSWADPEGVTDAFHTEKLVRLPRCAWAYGPPPGDAQAPVGSENHRREGPLVFGSFNLLTKVSQATVRLWGRLLAETSHLGTKLVMTDRAGLLGDDEAVEGLLAEFVAAGTRREQIELLPCIVDRVEHRKRYVQADLMLDPLSYNGTTTTCEALWHGLPTLTLPGTAHVSRVGVSLLTAAGLQDWIARDEADFLAKARTLAENPERVRSLRPLLRQQAESYALGDGVSLARALEDAYFAMAREKGIL